jgi:hypothetical protein
MSPGSFSAVAGIRATAAAEIVFRFLGHSLPERGSGPSVLTSTGRAAIAFALVVHEAVAEFLAGFKLIVRAAEQPEIGCRVPAGS